MCRWIDCSPSAVLKAAICVHSRRCMQAPKSTTISKRRRPTCCIWRYPPRSLGTGIYNGKLSSAQLSFDYICRALDNGIGRKKCGDVVPFEKFKKKGKRKNDSAVRVSFLCSAISVVN